MLVAAASSPVRDLPELIAQAKAAPGKLNYGTFGIGSSGHLNMEMFERAAGVRLTPVHYKGAAPMLNDLIAGHISFAFTGITLAAEPFKAGRLRVLAVGSPTRLAQFPEIPTFAESGLSGFEAYSWFGIFAPVRTSADIVAKINGAVQQLLANSEFVKRALEPAHLKPLPGTAAQFAAYVRSDSARWGSIIREARLTVE